jgi:hypothetical protein
MRSTLFLALGLVACGGQSAHPPGGASVGGTSSGDTSSGAGDDDAATSASSSGATLPQCTWPADLDPPDAGPSWGIARLYLKCDDGSDTELCLSNDPTICPGSNAIPGATETNCVDQCAADEYAVEYGGPPLIEPDGGFGGYPMPNLPATCHGGGGFPSGAVIVCCPCE